MTHDGVLDTIFQSGIQACCHSFKITARGSLVFYAGDESELELTLVQIVSLLLYIGKSLSLTEGGFRTVPIIHGAVDFVLNVPLLLVICGSSPVIGVFHSGNLRLG